MITIEIKKLKRGEENDDEIYLSRKFADDADIEVLKDALQDMYYSLLDEKIAF